MRYKLAWHHAGWYLLVLFNVVIYAVVGIIVRKRAEIHVGLCALHQRRRSIGRAAGWAGFAAIFAAIALGAIFEWTVVMMVGAAAILPLAIAILVLSPRLRADRIDPDFLRIRGCGAHYLDELPQAAE